MDIFLRSAFSKIFIFFTVSTAIFGAVPAFAQATFSVDCPVKKIGKNDVLQIQFKVDNAAHVETIIPPSFKDFMVVGGPNQQSGMTSINGKVDQYIAIGYVLQPKSTGKFIIGAATAKADGKEFHSPPITIEVTNAATSQSNSIRGNSLSPFSNFGFDLPSPPPTHQFDDYILKPGENPADKIQKDLFIKLDVNKTSCFVGQPIIASFKLYTRLRSETTITDAPSFNGFSVSDLDVNDNNNESIEKYNGRQYNVYTLRKVQLYPLQAGSITLDPLVSNNKVTFIKSEYANTQNGDRFYDMLENFADATTPENGIVEKTVSLTSKPVTIIVNPLPVDNKPSDFKGAVGNFTIQSSLEKNNITTDDAGNLIVTISGQGNIQLINAPKVQWPNGIEGYESKVKDQVEKGSVPMKGSKVFTFPFTTNQPGKYKIDSISFSYFDPATSSYKTLHTPPLELEVKKGTGVSNNLYVKKSEKTTSAGEDFFTTYKTDLIAGIALSVAVLFLIVFLINKKNKRKNILEKNIKVDDLQNKIEEKKPAFIIPENPLLTAHQCLMQQDSVAFYHELHGSLKKYLAGKFKLPVEELTKKRLNEELDKCNVGLGTSLMLNSLLEEVEINLYAPVSGNNHLTKVFEKASEVVSLLDKQVC
jgi:hypothetical protein